MTTIPASRTLQVHAIDPARLVAVRRAGQDEQGNPLVGFAAAGDGGEPLRCCLRRARPREPIALISYAPFDRPSVWREVGPVYVHAHDCAGPVSRHELPVGMRTGPLVLRTYHPDGSLDYEHITLLDEGADAAPVLADLLDEPDVDVVHVRTLRPQCFLYAVTRGQNCR